MLGESIKAKEYKQITTEWWMREFKVNKEGSEDIKR